MLIQVYIATIIVAAQVGTSNSHGHMTMPTGRNGGTMALAGDCYNFECFWFSQFQEIPGPPTVNNASERTFNVHVSSGPRDWSAKMPWRAPGTAPVLGSGCGVAGGSDKYYPNGGMPPPNITQGSDFLELPENDPVSWKRGSTQEVAWGVFANHGGGYQYRLCRNDGGKVDEECFQRTPLDFVGDKQWIRYAPLRQWDVDYTIPDVELPLVRIFSGHPKGSQWARNPMPGCNLCDQADCAKKATWEESFHCASACSGLNISHCPPGMTQFPEPAPGISGYYQYMSWYGDGLEGFKFNIVDKVKIPSNIPAGKYLLSWRWDCEQSRQIWQNCADIVIE